MPSSAGSEFAINGLKLVFGFWLALTFAPSCFPIYWPDVHRATRPNYRNKIYFSPERRLLFLLEFFPCFHRTCILTKMISWIVWISWYHDIMNSMNIMISWYHDIMNGMNIMISWMVWISWYHDIMNSMTENNPIVCTIY